MYAYPYYIFIYTNSQFIKLKQVLQISNLQRLAVTQFETCLYWNTNIWFTRKQLFYSVNTYFVLFTILTTRTIYHTAKTEINLVFNFKPKYMRLKQRAYYWTITITSKSNWIFFALSGAPIDKWYLEHPVSMH